MLTFNLQELRLADYNQGRRFGNGSGQAGAFGTSTGFGGFGGQTTAGGFGSNNQSTGLFGTQTTTSAPFGGSQTATSGFGSNNTGGGLFGSATSKPGGLFGSTPSQPAGGGLFGASNQSGGFGTQNNNAGTGFGNNQGGGLFGGNNNTNQQKSGFSFGQSNNNATSGFGASGNTGFGANNTTNTGGSLFGNNPTSAPFGGSQQPQTSNPFGGGFGNNQQNQNQTPTNAGSAFGGFGSNDQQKPGGLFGGGNTTTNTGAGLFGNTTQNNQQPSTTGGGLFGTANNNQTGGSSLFGAKPAATGTGLFGNTNTSNSGNTGAGLFGTNQNQNQQNQSGGLFGNANNQQQQKPGGLFGGSTGVGMFGSNNNNNQQQGSTSLFGGLGSNNQQQQSGGLFGNSNNNTSSLFGNNQQQQQPQQANNPLQAPQAYSASIFDANPYGSRSIFDGLPPPPQQYTGPIATPIGQKNKTQKGAVLPQYRINPHVASRFVTPQKRQGYGFTYSTYGTPSSASSNMSTPGGMSSSLLAGSISRGLGKSLSTSNLRRSFDPDSQESLLSPGAFSAGSGRYAGTGSLKKLTIDRSLRTDLFQSPPALPTLERSDQSRQASILKKKVSFDASTVGGNGGGQNDTQTNGANGVTENGRESAKSQSPEQPQPTPSQPNGLLTEPRSDGAPAQPEMEQVRGNELAVINEDGNHDVQPAENGRKAPQIPDQDPRPGDYYMKPSYEEIANMSTDQKKRVKDFRIGRENCGYVVFEQPVDLTTVPLDRIFGEIAQIELRSVTVYPDAKHKPARGKGLNVPSTICLANSWPRNRFEKNGPRFQKHVQRLERVQGTEFVRYEKDTGTWVFKVKHFSTYGFNPKLDETEDVTPNQPTEPPAPKSPLRRAGHSMPYPIPDQTSSRTQFNDRRLRLVSRKADVKRKLISTSFETDPSAYTKLMVQEIEVSMEEEKLHKSWLDDEMAEKRLDQKAYLNCHRDTNRNIISLGETLWTQRQVLRDLDEREGKALELGPDTKGAFVHTLLELYKDLDVSRARARSVQSAMVKAAKQAYQPSKGAPEGKYWCPISKDFFDCDSFKAAHIIPQSLEEGLVDYIFGKGESTRLNTADNCLYIHSSAEKSFDNGNFVLLPRDPHESPIKTWRIQVTNSFAVNCDMGRTRLGALHDTDVQFLTDSRPASRFLYYHFVVTLLRNKLYRNPGYETYLVELLSGKPFAIPGKYLRRSMLLTLAKFAGVRSAEEEQRLIGDGGQTFVERENLKEREELEISRKVMEAATRAPRENEDFEESEDSEEGEGSEDDGDS